MKNSFVHLNVHSEYSLLWSSIRISKLIQKAQEFEMKALALTDFGNMFGAIEFYTKAKKAGIKPILGAEIYFSDGPMGFVPDTKIVKNLINTDSMEAKLSIHRLVLLCKDNQGFENLCAIISKSYQNGFYYRPRANFDLLNEHKDGLIALSGATRSEAFQYLLNDQKDKAKKSLKSFQDIYKEDFYLEISNHSIKEENKIHQDLIQMAKELSIPPVVTNDCFYLEKNDSGPHEVLINIGSKKTLSDPDRVQFLTDEYYFKSQEEMFELHSLNKEGLENTVKIADQCLVNLKWEDESGNQIYHLPHFKIETEETQEEYFRRLTREGLLERFKGPHFISLLAESDWESIIRPQYIERMEEELNMIIEMGFHGYFLIVADFIQWAKARQIPVGPGRGSGAGSIVAYALKITNINPIPYNLLFERFINPERISMPDFDVDFCQQRRGEVIDYVTQKYGKERVGQIVTFGKLLAKAAIRDVSRVLSIPYTEADRLSKLVPEELGITLDEALNKEPKFYELMETDPKIKQVINISQRIEGLNRHAGIHAAGVIITSKPLIKYCSLFTGSKGEQVIQFDKNYSELIGLVKFDFLGLKTLTVITYASQFIRRDHDPDFDIEQINMEDKKVYKFISKGETKGVFQLESDGMIDLCKRIKPESIDDITAINALYRPGPMESGMVDDFVDIKNKKKKVSYPFPELEPVLKDTLGVIIYQEQVMNIARIIAGYTLGQADMLRRAMGKKKAEEMDRHKEIFRKGAIQNSFDESKAIDLFENMAKFASYGFNKSHAVAYAFIAYQTAYLKYYYRTEFFAGLLSTEMNNTDKITDYINNCKGYNILVMPPDINESDWHFSVSKKGIRFAFGAIKNVGQNAALEIVHKRIDGPFLGIVDFCERVDLRVVNKRCLESLIKVGAFDECETLKRKTLFDNVEKFMNHGQKIAEERAKGQVNLFEFGEVSEGEDVTQRLNIVDGNEFPFNEKLAFEFQLMGIYVSGHPLDPFAQEIAHFSTISVRDILNLDANKEKLKPNTSANKPKFGQKVTKEATVAGLSSQLKVIMTKKGEKMCFLTLEDLTGKIECVVFPKVYAEFESLFDYHGPLIFEGYSNLEESPKKFFPQKIKKLLEQRDQRVTGVRINVKIDQMNGVKLKQCKDILQEYKGHVPVHFIFETTEGRARLLLGENFLVDPRPQLTEKMNGVFQENCVKLIIDGKISS